MHFTRIEHNSDLYYSAVDLRKRLLRAPLGLDFTPEELAAEDAQFHFGLVDQSVLLACVVVVQISAFHAKLRQMAVETSRQGQGLGTSLIRSTESYLAEQGIRSMELNARDHAIGFYERLGYRPEGPRFIEVTIWHQKMRKAPLRREALGARR